MVDPKCWVWVGILIKKKFKSSSNATTKLSPLLFWVLFEIFDSQNFKGKSKLGNNEHVINPGEKVGEVATLIRCSLDSTISWVSQNDSLDLLCHKFLKKKLHESPSGHAMCVKILQTISLTPCIDGAL